MVDAERVPLFVGTIPYGQSCRFGLVDVRSVEKENSGSVEGEGSV